MRYLDLFSSGLLMGISVPLVTYLIVLLFGYEEPIDQFPLIQLILAVFRALGRFPDCFLASVVVYIYSVLLFCFYPNYSLPSTL